MHESFPKKKPGQHLKAEQINNLGAAVRQSGLQTTGMGNSLNNYGTFSANVPTPEHFQRVVKIAEEIDESLNTYTVYEMYYNSTAQEWVADETLGPYPLDGGYSPDQKYEVDDVLIAYFDRQRYSYVPISTASTSTASDSMWCVYIDSKIDDAVKNLGTDESYQCAYRGTCKQMVSWPAGTTPDLCSPEFRVINDAIIIVTEPTTQELTKGSIGWVRAVGSVQGSREANVEITRQEIVQNEDGEYVVEDQETTEISGQLFQWCCGCVPEEDDVEVRQGIQAESPRDSTTQAQVPATGSPETPTSTANNIDWNNTTENMFVGRQPGYRRGNLGVEEPYDTSVFLFYELPTVPQGSLITKAELRAKWYSPDDLTAGPGSSDKWEVQVADANWPNAEAKSNPAPIASNETKPISDLQLQSEIEGVEFKGRVRVLEADNHDETTDFTTGDDLLAAPVSSDYVDMPEMFSTTRSVTTGVFEENSWRHSASYVDSDGVAWKVLADVTPLVQLIVDRQNWEPSNSVGGLPGDNNLGRIGFKLEDNGSDRQYVPYDPNNTAELFTNWTTRLCVNNASQNGGYDLYVEFETGSGVTSQRPNVADQDEAL